MQQEHDPGLWHYEGKVRQPRVTAGQQQSSLAFAVPSSSFQTQEQQPCHLAAWVVGRDVFVFTLGASAEVPPTVLLHTTCPEEKETLKTCTWAAGNQFQLAVAGRLGVIRVFGVYEGLHVLQNLVGHTGSVNHLCTKPDDPDIILSASTDGSVRMWNICTGKCLAIYSGALQGHREPATACSFHISGQVFASGGGEAMPLIWNLSHLNSKGSDLASNIFRIPDWSTKKAHAHMIEGIMWYGNSVLSKAVGEPPKLWFLIPLAGSEDNLLLEPHEPTNLVPSRPSFVRTYDGMPLQDTFSTVAMDQDKHYLAVGSPNGVVYVWLVDHPHQPIAALMPFSTSKKQAIPTITAVAFSPDGRSLLAATSKGQLHHWHRVEQAQ